MRTDFLRRGETGSCGCQRRIRGLRNQAFLDDAARKKLDLAGQRFGKLTVLRPAENIGVKTAWVCRCDCGRETVIRTNQLRTGHNTSCGCSGGAENARNGLTFVDGTCVEIIQSKKLQKNNTSGVTGVTWVTSKRLWQAAICFKGKRRTLGRYRNFEDAVKARKRAEEDLYDSFLRAFAAERSPNNSG